MSACSRGIRVGKFLLRKHLVSVSRARLVSKCFKNPKSNTVHFPYKAGPEVLFTLPKGTIIYIYLFQPVLA